MSAAAAVKVGIIYVFVPVKNQRFCSRPLFFRAHSADQSIVSESTATVPLGTCTMLEIALGYGRLFSQPPPNMEVVLHALIGAGLGKNGMLTLMEGSKSIFFLVETGIQLLQVYCKCS